MTPTASPSSSLVERLADAMAARWAAGDRPLAEQFLAAHPALARSPVAVLDLLAEELALRDEHREPTTADALAARFPRFAAQVRALVECQRALGLRPGPASFPEVGDRLGGFVLLAELGRGAVGRVFLATQPDLGDRAVVLKVTPARGTEHLSLARLQHTHVVPLYSAHEFPDRGLRGLCLPYFGGATLADLAAPPGPDLVAALKALRPPVPVPLVADGPALRFLERAGPADAVCWVGACLADALQYAHDRGLLHLDLKPSNVLVAADGTPMLLDFHLARPPLSAGDPPPPWLGGTPGFAPPEQGAAVRAVLDGTPVPAAVDARADVFALGVLLTAVAGPGLPVGVRDVLAKCASPDPADRYPTAAAVAADLRRHLADLPLKGVRNRSVAERWRKWRRRRPGALPVGLAVAAVGLAVAAAGGHVARQTDRARAALRDGENRLARKQFSEAVEVLRGGEAVAAGLPVPGALGADLRAARAAAERGLAAAELHRLVERVRPLYAAEGVPPADVRAAAGACRELWSRRAAFADPDDRTRADLLDAGVLAAHLTARAGGPFAGDEALSLLAEAEAAFGPNKVLALERAARLRQLGRAAAADDAARRAEELPSRTAWDHLAAGRAHLGAGDPERAARDLDRALALDPASLWANYHRGEAALRLGDPGAATAAFTACLALEPGAAWCWYNRGLAHAAAGRAAAARADADKAVSLDPGLAAAARGRFGPVNR